MALIGIANEDTALPSSPVRHRRAPLTGRGDTTGFDETNAAAVPDVPSRT
jgi:hypothetical protein